MTREELFLLVWSDRMPVISARLGVSGAVIRSRCFYFNIPCPDVSYWLASSRGESPGIPVLPAWDRKKRAYISFRPMRLDRESRVQVQSPPTVPTGPTELNAVAAEAIATTRGLLQTMINVLQNADRQLGQSVNLN